ncbi:MAG: hypothetical protein LUE92_11550 [Clostridiales bacterium]|nr:hypothetical protein [Clostridiales bacterium]
METLEHPMSMPEKNGGQETEVHNKADKTPDNGNAASGQSYGYNDQELIRALVKSRMEQKQPLEYEDLDGYEMPPRSQFSMLKKPAVSIKYGKLSFNMACIRLFEGVQYIIPIYHPQKKRMTVVMCREEEYASVDWARIRQKDGEWVNKEITSREYVDKLYRLMGWNKECRYKVLGRVANSRDGLVLVFELEEAVMFESKSMEYVDEKTGETRQKKQQVMYYPEYYKDRVGKSYNDYVSARQINMFEYLEGYVGNTYSDYQGADGSDKNKQEAAGGDTKRDDSNPSVVETVTIEPVSNETAAKGFAAEGTAAAHHAEVQLSGAKEETIPLSQDSYGQRVLDLAASVPGSTPENNSEIKPDQNTENNDALKQGNTTETKDETTATAQTVSGASWSGW